MLFSIFIIIYLLYCVLIKDNCIISASTDDNAVGILGYDIMSALPSNIPFSLYLHPWLGTVAITIARITNYLRSDPSSGMVILHTCQLAIRKIWWSTVDKGDNKKYRKFSCLIGMQQSGLLYGNYTTI